MSMACWKSLVDSNHDRHYLTNNFEKQSQLLNEKQQMWRDDISGHVTFKNGDKTLPYPVKNIRMDNLKTMGAMNAQNNQKTKLKRRSHGSSLLSKSDYVHIRLQFVFQRKCSKVSESVQKFKIKQS